MELMLQGTKITPPIRFGLDALPEDGIRRLTLERAEGIAEGGYRRSVQGGNVTVSASDDAGFMYALLDLAEELRCGNVPEDAEVTPYILNRGIKFNIPLDARVPSYTDAGTSASRNIANMWDMGFWKEFLDRMAENKYNVLSLWTLSPFPALVRIPEFPEACVEDVKVSVVPVKADTRGIGMYSPDMTDHLVTIRKMTIEEKTEFWRQVMAYARDRCIRIYLFTWNVFTYGTEGNPYGITDDQYNPVTREYYYYGTRALMDAFPLLAGIGITAGENMTFRGSSEVNKNPDYRTDDIDFSVETYGKAVHDYLLEHPGRQFSVIHRMQMARYKDILQAFSRIPQEIEISFKYSQAHMYSSPRPQFIADFLEEKDPDTRFWLTVRNDDFYMLRWGNPEYARAYLRNMPVGDMIGFYMGPDGLIWGRDYFSRQPGDHPLFVDKMWYMFRIWGELSYNIHRAESYFTDLIRRRFGLSGEEATALYEGWKEASAAIPEATCIHWHNFDFQWYPEGCCMREHSTDKIVFYTVDEFMQCPSITGGEYASVAETAEAMACGRAPERISAEETAVSILRHVEKAGEWIGSLGTEGPGREELCRTIRDIRAMIRLGEYYGLKIRAAIRLCMFRKTGEAAEKAEAVQMLEKAAEAWESYSAMIAEAYRAQVLPRFGAKIDVTDFDEMAGLDIQIAKNMEAEQPVQQM